MKKIFFCVAATSLLGTHASSAAEFKFGNQILKVPDGFEVELVSNTNIVHRPVSMDFDELGRLYVTDSSGSSEKGPTQYEKKDHRVMRLEDTNGDGKFDKSTVFADNMMFPEGCMYYDGSVYVSAVPSIWKLTDTNNDGVADVRVEWHQGKTITGCANDLHGPYLGPDGWIYWCKGAFAEQTYEVNGKPFTTKASHIFRARPDHTGIEPVLTGGMDNPVSVAFSPEGERFLCGTFFEPQVPGHRDGIIHAIYGGVYGKPHPDVLNGFKRTGDLMPVMTYLGASASASVISYRSKIFGDDFQNNLFVANFNLHNVTRHVLEPDGATYKTKDSVFLSCEGDPDFHPTHVLEDADGSLLVIDTGGWYKICCPTSQLYKPDVLGAIYRIRKVGAKKVEDPRGLKIDWAKAKPVELAKFLGDERVFVQQRAIHELGKRGESSVPALRAVLESASKPKSTNGSGKKQFLDEFHRIEAARKSDWPKGAAERQNAIWALTRIESPKAREAVRLAFKDFDSEVRAVAFQSASLHRDKNAVKVAEPKSSWQVMILKEERLYFELLGRTSAFDRTVRDHVHSMIDTSQLLPSEGRVLQHSFTYALIEANSPKIAREFLDVSVSEPDIRPAVLIALDQMENGDLKLEDVLPLLSSEYKFQPDFRSAALWILEHHSEWGDSLTDYLQNQFKGEFSAEEQVDFEKLLSNFTENAKIQELLAIKLQIGNPKVRRIVLHAIAQSNLKTAPESWTAEITKLLGAKETVADAIAAADAVPASKEKSAELSEALLKIGHDKSQSAELRLNALAALPNISNLDSELFDFLLANLDSTKPVLTRGAATSVLTRGKLSQEQLLALTDALKNVGPLEATKLLNAFEKQSAVSELVGTKLIAALKEAKSIKTMRVERLKPLFAKYPAAVQEQAESLYALLNVDAKAEAAHVDELLASLKNGDIRRGQMVFNGTKAACSSCHSIGYAGGHVGPDLTTIGTVRTERDLLEAIVYPSASFVRSFEPMIVTTKDGEDYSGVLKKDAPDEIVLASGPNAEMKIARSDIAEMRPGTISVMPQGLDEQLTKQELADLVAFLKATKW